MKDIVFKYVIKKAFITAIAIASITLNIVGVIYLYDLKKEMRTPIQETTEVEVPVAEPDTLSTWNIFTLALMKVESEYNNDAVSSAGAKGYFQMTPIYVKEVNRIHHTNYSFSQVTDFNTAYEIFDLMQKAHNPNYSMDKALTLHNGDHLWYKKKVYKAMDQIRLYEEMRSKIKSI